MMTKRFPIVAALIAALALPAMTTTLSASDVRCRVPFNFSAGGRVLAAGVYSLSTQSAGIVIRSSTDGVIAITNSASATKAGDPRLVFEKYGDRYRLKEVWMGGTTGVELVRTKAERRWLEASLNTPVEIVVLPLN